MPPPRMEEIDFDLESIKYDRKHEDTENQQGMVANKNVKNKTNVLLNDLGSGDNQIRDSDKVNGITVGKYADHSQDIDAVGRLELMEKDLIALERDLLAKEGNDIKNDEIGSEITKDGAMTTKTVDLEERNLNSFGDASVMENDSEPVRIAVLRDSGHRTSGQIDVNSVGQDSRPKDLETLHDVKPSEKKKLSETIKEPFVCSKVDQNNKKTNIKHSTGDGAKEIKDDVSEEMVDTKDHKTETVGDINETVLRKHKEVSELKTVDTLDKGDSIVKNDVDKVINKTDHVPKLKLDVKQICDSGEETQFSELLKLRSVSSPNFEKSFPFASDERNHRTSEIREVENLKKPDVDRTKPALKSCMSEAVIKCDKVNNSKSDKSPSLRRKVESTCLTDQSDPLQSYQKSHDDSIFQSSLEMEEQLQKNRFKLKKALENVILSISPYIHYDLPYLETELGSRCELRKYFPEEIYWSHHFR